MRITLKREWYIPKGAQEIRANDSSAVAYLAPYTYPLNGQACFHAVAFSGKRNKPDWNHTFKTEEQARKYIAEHADGVKRSEEFRSKVKADRYDVRATEHYKVGDILSTSWGYDQTNVEFFKIVRVLDKSVEVRAIGAKSVEGSEGFMSCRLLPDPSVELTDAWECKHNGIKRVTRYGDSVSVRIHDHSSGQLVSENSSGKYCSWYA